MLIEVKPSSVNHDDPVYLADSLGTQYAAVQSSHRRKELGLYLTPVPVARFMAEMSGFEGELCSILDPAAGSGVLLAALVQHLVLQPRPPKVIRITAYEIDRELAEMLATVMSSISAWARAYSVDVIGDIRNEDFVLACASILSQTFGALPLHDVSEAFDVIIANPPYFKLSKGDPRAVVTSAVVHGQPNIYGVFLAISAAMLRAGGRLVTITPRSFATGTYFKRFRQLFFHLMLPTWVHVFNSRREAFGRDDILQETIIMRSIRQDDWARTAEPSPRLKVTTSHSASDIAQRACQDVDIIDALGSADQVFRLISSEIDDRIVRTVQSWQGSLKSFGMRVSTGPVVPFRATSFIASDGSVPGTHVPLLWMNHVNPMRIDWPISSRKQEYIHRTADERRLLVPNRNYVLLRRFSSKEQARRLVAAPYDATSLPTDLIGFENHLNYIYRPNSSLSIDESRGLAAILSSKLLDDYFRTSNGNTQVNATELRAMPLPDLSIVEDIGRRITTDMSLEDIDSLVSGVLM